MSDTLRRGADVEEWSWIERRRDGGAIQLNASRHSLQDLALFAREGKRGVCPGASVHRRSDGLWIPLTEVRPCCRQAASHAFSSLSGVPGPASQR